MQFLTLLLEVGLGSGGGNWVQFPVRPSWWGSAAEVGAIVVIVDNDKARG